MNLKYKIGDFVILKDLSKFDSEGNPKITLSMCNYSGKKVKILYLVKHIFGYVVLTQDKYFFSVKEEWIIQTKDKLKNIINR